MKPRITHLLFSLAPGGMENGVVNTINLLQKEFDFSVICLERTGSFEKRLPPNVRVYQLHKRPGKNLWIAFRIRKILVTEKTEIIHTHNFATHLYGTLAVLGKKIRVIAGEHGELYLRPRTREDLFLRKALALRTTKFHAVSDSLRQRLAVLTGFDPKKIALTPNGVDTQLFQPIPKREAEAALELTPSRFTLGVAGRLIPSKNHRFLFQALCEIKDRLPKFRLLVAGDGPLKKELLKTGASLGLKDYLVFLGHCSKMHLFYPALDLLVHPSLSEGFSNVILEAMSCGVPVLAADIPANQEVIEEEYDGFFFNPAKPFTLSEKIFYLTQRPERLFSAGQKARAKILARYPLKKMVEDYRRLYWQVLEKNEDFGSPLPPPKNTGWL